jgi:RNA polymerase sigma-70 factor (ECF subfamily)
MSTSFPSTRWSLIARASSESDVGSRDLMGELLSCYWRPMLVHLHYKGLSNESAEDLAQDFVVELLDQNLLSIADPAKGRFRSLLLTALDHFFVSRVRYEQAAKRSPGRLASLDAEDYDHTRGDDAGAALAFERAWALDVLAEALSRMEQECADSGEVARWQIFQERIVLPLFSDLPETDYGVLAERFGLGHDKAAMNVLVTAKRQFARVLRDVIREYITRTPSASGSAGTRARLESTSRARATADVDLHEHQIRQAVEREIGELQEVLSQTRAVADLVGDLREEPECADAAKSRFWRLMTAHDLESNPWSVLFTAGTEVDDLTLSAGCEETLQRPLRQVPGCGSADAVTIGQLLRSDRPPLPVLQSLKGWFNLQRFSPVRDVPAPLANGLYLLVLAVALIRRGERITGLADPQFRAGLEWLADQRWLGEDLRTIVVAARDLLSA